MMLVRWQNLKGEEGEKGQQWSWNFILSTEKEQQWGLSGDPPHNPVRAR